MKWEAGQACDRGSNRRVEDTTLAAQSEKRVVCRREGMEVAWGDGRYATMLDMRVGQACDGVGNRQDGGYHPGQPKGMVGETMRGARRARGKARCMQKWGLELGCLVVVVGVVWRLWLSIASRSLMLL